MLATMFDRLRKLGDAVGPLRASAQDLGRRELVPDYSPHDADDVVAMTSHLDRLPAQRGVGGTLWGDTVLVVANAVPIRTTRIGGPPLADEAPSGTDRRLTYRIHDRTGQVVATVMDPDPPSNWFRNPAASFLARAFDVVDRCGAVAFRMERATHLASPDWIVTSLAGDELGALVTTRMVDHYRMSLRLGAMSACSLTSDCLLPRRFTLTSDHLPSGPAIGAIVVPDLGHTTMRTLNGRNAVLAIEHDVDLALHRLMVAATVAVATAVDDFTAAQRFL